MSSTTEPAQAATDNDNIKEEKTENVWDVFGSDSDDDDDDDDNNIANLVAESSPDSLASSSSYGCSAKTIRLVVQQLTQHWMRQNPNVRLSQRHVGLFIFSSSSSSGGGGGDNNNDSTTNETAWRTALAEREIIVVLDEKGDNSQVRKEQTLESGKDPDTFLEFAEPKYDALIWSGPNTNSDKDEDGGKPFEKDPFHLVVPGGFLILSHSVYEQATSILHSQEWITLETIPSLPQQNPGSRDEKWLLLQRRVCGIQETTCRWLPSHYSKTAEYDRVAQATIALSVYERQNRRLTESSIARAVRALQQHGYCILAGGLVDPVTALQYGQAALQDLRAVADILQKQGGDGGGVALYESGAIARGAMAYRELSQREDFRADLRHGPALQRIRGGSVGNNDGNAPRTITALTKETNDFLRGHGDLLEIVRRVMNPVDERLSPGNFGRYNFEGRGPDGSFQDIRVGPVGAIISWPGAADQALHADTPHLFEHVELLPAHYINIFTPGRDIPGNDADLVGQSAFLDGTHRLDVTARYQHSTLLQRDGEVVDDASNASADLLWKHHLVRPRLQVSDVVLFDCRILHFGLANESKHGIERPLLYTNVTMHWFHDPKNWDNERCIFPDLK